jgi:hypothetical protein
VPVTLVVPVTGAAALLEDLYARLCRQTCRPTRLLLVVESIQDPAFARASALRGRDGLEVHVLVAGLARHAGQKCHNLAYALRRNDLLEEHVVLADADIAPEPTWLADLLFRVHHGTADIVTAYRWLMPQVANLPTLACAWLDRSIATLPKWDALGMCWGGSIAMRRETMLRLDAVGLLGAEILDDLALADAARAHGLRVTFRAAVLVATPSTHTWRSLLAFGTRQYQFIRLYRPWLWRLAAALVLVQMSAGTILVALAPISDVALPALLASWLAGVATGVVRSNIGARCAATVRPGRRTEGLLCLMPIVAVCLHALHGLMLWRSRSQDRIVWSHCRYRLDGRRVVTIERNAWAGVSDRALGKADAFADQ